MVKNVFGAQTAGSLIPQVTPKVCEVRASGAFMAFMCVTLLDYKYLVWLQPLRKERMPQHCMLMFQRPAPLCTLNKREGRLQKTKAA